VNHSEIVNWLWGVADLIRDTFKRGKYQDVILPLTVLRNPGEHFTPRNVVHLMVDPMLAGGEVRIRRKGIVCTVYDPCCGLTLVY
jgi:type I restriction-modification system DNA methylase subunit